MARTPFSLLLLRRLSLSTLNPRLPRLFTAIKPLSTSSDSSPHSSLSARMSFVFDQIDAMEKERFDKDETLHRIRAWRESKKAQSPEPDSELSRRGETVADSAPEPKRCEDEGGETKSEVELVHPWPEWIELMERLVQQNYFDHRRKDEDKMIDDLGFEPAISQAPWAGDITGLDFKNFKLVQTACINFGKDRFDIFRSLSRQDIQTLVGFGCPSADKKVVFSAKLLRKHVHLDEGDVCSSCSLRSSCDRAYLLTMKEDEARFIDIMRVLLAYGFDPLNGAELNPSPMKQKSVKTVVRKLLHQVVRLSSVPIDPNLPPPIIRRPPPKVKQPPPPPKKRVGRDDIEMKKGDWLCPKCDFMNFAKNNVCLQCDAKRPKRQLLPGEWECPQCNFLNYRRNIVCFHCDCKRPPDEFTENKMQEKQQGPRMRAENMTNRSEVSNAWNFDFDDDESDGADVAAFEYADSSAMEKGPFDNRGEGGMSGKPEHDFNRASRDVRGRDGEYSDADSGRPGIGFDDFNDEDDDVDNYEIDNGNSSVQTMASSDDFPNFERRSRSEAIYGFDKNSQSHRAKLQSYNSQSKPTNRRACFGSDDDDDDDVDLESDSELSAKRNSHRGSNPLSHNNQFKVVRKRRAFSGSEDDELDSDSDSELSAKPKWKSSHVSDSRPRGRGKGSKGPSKSLSFGSDDELGLYSDMDDEPNGNFRSKQGKDNDFRRRGSSRMKDSFSVLESDNEDSRSYGNRPRGNVGPNRGPSDSKGRNKYNSTRDTRQRSGGMKNSRNSFEDDDDEDFGGSSRGSRGRGSSARTRMNDRNGSARNFKEPRSAGFGKKGFEEPRTGGFRKQHHGRRDGHGRDLENGGVDEFKNSRRVIER